MQPANRVCCEQPVFGNPQNYVSLRNDMYFVSSVRLLSACKFCFVLFWCTKIRRGEFSVVHNSVQGLLQPNKNGGAVEEGTQTGVLFDIQVIKLSGNIIRLIAYFFDF
jgi:hypothetical protein